MRCYRGLQDGDMVDIETKTAQRLDDSVAVGGQTVVGLMCLRLHLNRKLLPRKPQACGHHAELRRMELDLQDMCRNGNRIGRLRGDRGAGESLLNAIARSD